MSLNKASQKNNTFFDIQIQQENCTKKICVMVNSITSRNFFMGKCDSKTPVQLSGINGASGTLFSKSNAGSNINFKLS